MVNLDDRNLFCVTAGGHGLRETLFYNLFSYLQVYKTRADMLSALPCITHGALSLDGGMITKNGLFLLGSRENFEVKFPLITGRSGLSLNYSQIETRIRKLRWEQHNIEQDMLREQQLLDKARAASSGKPQVWGMLQQKAKLLKFRTNWEHKRMNFLLMLRECSSEGLRKVLLQLVLLSAGNCKLLICGQLKKHFWEFFTGRVWPRKVQLNADFFKTIIVF